MCAAMIYQTLTNDSQNTTKYFYKQLQHNERQLNYLRHSFIDYVEWYKEDAKSIGLAKIYKKEYGYVTWQGILQ